MSFNLTGEQVTAIVRMRDQIGMTTGELVRRACEKVTDEKIRAASPQIYHHHLTVLMPKDLKRRLRKIAKASKLSISDIVRIACEDFFRSRAR